MPMRRISVLLSILFLVLTSPKAMAFTIEDQDMRMGVNGYLNTIYTYMSTMPMQMGPSIVEMADDTSTFENDSNLIFNVHRDRLRANLNLQFRNAFSSDGTAGGSDTKGEFDLLELFGEYAFGEPLEVRFGQFLSPFGIYNHIRFITPLFAPVVLPMMYQPPGNFPGHALVPEQANVMLSGKVTELSPEVHYAVYLGNGERAATGRDANKDKGYGARLRLLFPGDAMIGVSYYSANDEPGTEGRHHLYGVDLEFKIGRLHLQSEYVEDDLERQGDRSSYYARLTYDADQFSPFIGYDVIKDRESILFDSDGQDRYSAGVGYTVDNNIILKVEYHYHLFRDDAGFGQAPEDIHMFRTAAIIIF